MIVVAGSAPATPVPAPATPVPCLKVLVPIPATGGVSCARPALVHPPISAENLRIELATRD